MALGGRVQCGPNMKATISATELGQYGSSRFCLHCAWVRLHVKPLPFQSFPGIFSTIDRYNKFIVQNHFDRENALPVWLKDLGEVGSYINPPHWSKFQVTHDDTGVTVRGEADGIFKMSDDSYTIVDYKTSKYSPAQRGMYSNYEVQLNAYAYIGQRFRVIAGAPVGVGFHGTHRRRGNSPGPEIGGPSGLFHGIRSDHSGRGFEAGKANSPASPEGTGCGRHGATPCRVARLQGLSSHGFPYEHPGTGAIDLGPSSTLLQGASGHPRLMPSPAADQPLAEKDFIVGPVTSRPVHHLIVT